MTGHVDDFGRAILQIEVRHPVSAKSEVWDAWIDTACTLGDGSQVLLDTYTCHINWFGETRKVEIVASTGSFPLIGVGLLEDHELNIHYPNRTVQLG
jgi:predicted aspartyl protease